MPNHIQNRLVFSGAANEVNKLMKAISSEEEGKHIAMDFNKILPMPEELAITSGSSVDNVIDIINAEAGNWAGVENKLQWPAWVDGAGITKKDNLFTGRAKMLTYMKKDLSEKEWQEGRQAMVNIVKYGCKDWYSWCNKYWGTKWNAYGQPDDRNTDDTIFFQTAWSSPVELMQKLSGLFPKVTIELTFADEDSGSNTGKVTFKDGEELDSDYPESQSKEGYELYFELNPGYEDDYEFKNGTYHYKDEE